MIRPPRLAPGDRVAVVAASGPVPREGFAAGVKRLANRYELIFDDALFSAQGFLAGDDARRAAELDRALADPTIRAVWHARGGYGLTRILPALRLGPPRIVIGFSDVTALHGALACAGWSSVHGPVLTQLGNLLDDDVNFLVNLLEQPAPPPAWTELVRVAPGRATGRIVGGNLEVLTRLIGTPWLPPLDGAILALEEVGERPYRVDRALTHLAAAGLATRVAGVVVGDLVSCVANATESSATVEQVIAERLATWGVPVLRGAPFGHGTRNRAFPLGARVTLDADACRLDFLDGAVT